MALSKRRREGGWLAKGGDKAACLPLNLPRTSQRPCEATTKVMVPAAAGFLFLDGRTQRLRIGMFEDTSDIAMEEEAKIYIQSARNRHRRPG